MHDDDMVHEAHRTRLRPNLPILRDIKYTSRLSELVGFDPDEREEGGHTGHWLAVRVAGAEAIRLMRLCIVTETELVLPS